MQVVARVSLPRLLSIYTEQLLYKLYYSNPEPPLELIEILLQNICPRDQETREASAILT